MTVLSSPRVVAGDARCFAVIRIAGPEAEILTLATHPDDQGQGRATRLLSSVLDHLATAAVEEVFLEVDEANAPALALYRKAGFVAYSTRTAYYRDGQDAICMKAVLSATSAP